MSANGKRVLPTTAASTAALVPFSHPEYAGGPTGKAGDSDELIDQLVGGLVQADRSTKTEANFFNQREDAGSYGRTYSIDDEEIDEPPVPIPSTWQAQTAPKEPSWFAEQLKASAYGFVIGLFVVIPAVMLLTGQTERLPSWAAVTQYASTTATQFGIDLKLDNAQSLTTNTESEAPTTVTSSEAPSVAREPSTPSTPTATREPAQTAAVSTPESSGVSVTSREPAATAAEKSAPKPATTPAQQTAALATPRDPGQTSESGSGQQDVDPAAPPPAAPAATQVEAPEASTTAPEQTAASDAPKASTTGDETALLVGRLENAIAEKRASEQAAGQATESGASGETSSAPADNMPDALTIETAQFLMKNGKMEDGRSILAKLASRGNAAAIFGLAESFDPNVLAAWGASGVVAEPEKAKIFYSMALSQGVEKAISRLKGLE